MEKNSVQQKKALFSNKFDLNLRKKLVKWYTLSIAFTVLKMGLFGK